MTEFQDLTSFHTQRIERNQKQLREAKKNTRAHRPDRSETILNQAENKALATACKNNVQKNVRKLANNIQKQVAKVNAMMQELSEMKNVQNKANESYPCLFSVSTDHNEGGKFIRKRKLENQKRNKRRKFNKRNKNIEKNKV